MELTIKDFWIVLKKSILFVLVAALVFGACGYVYTSAIAQRQYTSKYKGIMSAEKLVDPGAEEDPYTATNNYMVTASRFLPIFLECLHSRETMKKVLYIIEKTATNDPSYVLQKKYTPSQLESITSFAIENDGEYPVTFSISCRTDNPHDALIILKGIEAVQAEVLETFWPGITEIYSITTYQEPEDGSLTSITPTKSAFLAAVLGAVAIYAVCFILTFARRRIYTEAELKELCDYPVLAQIPHIHTTRGKQK
ncbi:MAG: hypothetical protein J6K61_02315 [Clostridia bacterium]|nr:hypothetical protein [Clostridia bacterium]